jgi:putative oxidoreductase
MTTVAEDFGKLILRLIVGGLMLFHGVGKIVSGIDGIKQALTASNLPEFVAYGVYVGEVIAPVLMVIGFMTRPAALVFAFNMLVAVLLAHRGEIFSLNQYNIWAIELQAFFFFTAIAIACLGAGKFSASRGEGRWD